MFVPLVWLTALLILSIFGMPAMVEHVASRRFPQLARRQGGSIAGSVWNGVVALAGLIGLGLVSIPFWLLPPLWPLIPVAIMGWLNQRVLRYDALAEHATGEEMQRMFARGAAALYVLGAILALLAYVPLVGFLAPVLFGLAFIHLLLGELQALRQAPIEGEVLRAPSAGLRSALPAGRGRGSRRRAFPAPRGGESRGATRARRAAPGRAR